MIIKTEIQISQSGTAKVSRVKTMNNLQFFPCVPNLQYPC